MSTPLTRVHAAIVAVVPEIGGTCSSCGKKNPLASELCDPPSLPHCNVRPRPATLADVLRAIEKRTAQDYWRMPYWFGLDTDGNGNARFTHMYGDGKNEGYELTCISWNLKNDSLDAQSPETLEFLCSILCV